LRWAWRRCRAWRRRPQRPADAIGRFVYRHGGSVNFRGLRAFKEKFSPEWQPRYLAYPGGAALPRILTDVSALVAGGYRQLFRA
jgi:phosphatidylglycerol lysyltransferase